MEIPKEISEKAKDFDAVVDDSRFSILMAIRSTDVVGVGKHSLTFSELAAITKMPTPNLSYHLEKLTKRGILSKKKYPDTRSKKETYYHIEDKGVHLLDMVGLNREKIIEINSELKE